MEISEIFTHPHTEVPPRRPEMLGASPFLPEPSLLS